MRLLWFCAFRTAWAAGLSSSAHLASHRSLRARDARCAYRRRGLPWSGFECAGTSGRGSIAARSTRKWRLSLATSRVGDFMQISTPMLTCQDARARAHASKVVSLPPLAKLSATFWSMRIASPSTGVSLATYGRRSRPFSLPPFAKSSLQRAPATAGAFAVSGGAARGPTMICFYPTVSRKLSATLNPSLKFEINQGAVFHSHRQRKALCNPRRTLEGLRA